MIVHRAVVVQIRAGFFVCVEVIVQQIAIVDVLNNHFHVRLVLNEKQDKWT